MKKLYIIIISILCLAACKTSYQTASVNYLSGDANTLTLRCVGYGNTKITILEDAEKNAVSTLLFRGIPDSQQKNPLVSISEIEAIKTHKKYFNDFFEKGRYKTFVMSSIPVGDITKYHGTTKQQTLDIKLNLRALRTDLEQNGVIRKFGL